MLTETGVEGFLSLTHVLLPTVTTADEVDDIGVLTGDIGVDFHNFRGCLGSDKFASLDKLTSSASPTFVHSFLLGFGKFSLILGSLTMVH